MSEQDYYTILGLTADADGTAVDQAYWHLARKYQAMAPSDPRAFELLDELNEAYGVLGTPNLRDEYDRSRSTEQGDIMPRHQTKNAAPPSLRSRIVAMLGLRPSSEMTDEPASVPPFQQPSATRAPASRIVARGGSVDELRSSTASIVGRWRQAADAQAQAPVRQPDTTLVDIFKSEQELGEPEEPLSAVLDVLRGTKQPASTT